MSYLEFVSLIFTIGVLAGIGLGHVLTALQAWALYGLKLAANRNKKEGQ